MSYPHGKPMGYFVQDINPLILDTSHANKNPKQVFFNQKIQILNFKPLLIYS